MSKYWDINHILPYQRPFNFITGPRSIGKTYTTQKWLLKQALDRGRCTGYITRTLMELRSGALAQSWQKVCVKEYPYIDFEFNAELISVGGKPIIYGLPLSQVQKLKKQSFPFIWYFIFDEYQIEEGTGKYWGGYTEPDQFINLYHTVDREEQRVKCFFLGNNTSYYNPYHVHPVFGLPSDPAVFEPNKPWTNKICLYESATVSEELQREKDQNPFLKALNGTRYGDYANKGIYRDDSYTNISALDKGARQLATFRVEGETFGLFNNPLTAQFIFSKKYDPSHNWKIGLDKSDIKDGFEPLKPENKFLRDLIRKHYIVGGIAYESMEVKARIEPKLIAVL